MPVKRMGVQSLSGKLPAGASSEAEYFDLKLRIRGPGEVREVKLSATPPRACSAVCRQLR